LVAGRACFSGDGRIAAALREGSFRFSEASQMGERLTIKGFAGLKQLSIDLRKINVFIGPQATGKSVVAKLLYFFRSIPERLLLQAAYEGSTEERLRSSCLERFEEYFPRSTWGEAGFSARYDCGNEFVRIQRGSGKRRDLRASWSGYYGNLLGTLAGLVGRSRQEHPVAQAIDGSDRYRIYTELSRLAADKGVPEFHFTQLFVAANRSFFAQVKSNILGLLRERVSIDPFFLAFSEVYDTWKHFLSRARSERRGRMNSDWAVTDEFLKEVLGARYVLKDGEDFLEFSDGRVVDMGHASSGQQEALPLAIILQTLALVASDTNGRIVYIEEPEAHLFPITQRRVVEFMATVFNGEPDRLQFVVTTHSPYILTALNNLLQAGRLAKELKGKSSALKRLHQVVPKTQLLSADDVSAYHFDGKSARSIMAPEGLIGAEEIDSVSEDLAVQFDKILDIGG